MVWMTSLQMSVALVSAYLDSPDFASVFNVCEFSIQKVKQEQSAYQVITCIL